MSSTSDGVHADPLPIDAQRLINRLVHNLGFDEERQSNRLELAAGYISLHRIGVPIADASGILSRAVLGIDGNDGGVDLIAVCVGDTWLEPDSDEDTLDELIARLGRRHIHVILVQATGVDPNLPTSPKLVHKLGSFFSGLNLFFFAEPGSGELTTALGNWIGLRTRLFEALRRADIATPPIKVHASLVWARPIAIEAIHRSQLKATTESLARALGLPIQSVDISIIGYDDFYARATRHFAPRDLRVPASSLLVVPPVSGVADAYMGYILATDLIRGLTPPSRDFGNIDREVFADNVRAFLGLDAGHNGRILDTLSDAETRRQFHLVNNGIAIIADSAENEGQELKLNKIQIVNGCQTTSVLASIAREGGAEALEGVLVPTRVVVVTQPEIVDRVIVGLNSQSAIDRFALLGRQPFVLRIAHAFDEFNTKSNSQSIVFARRENEFAFVGDNRRVVRLQDALAAYWQIFATAPHGDAGPEVLEDAIERGALLAAHHDPKLYMAAGVIHALIAMTWADQTELTTAIRYQAGAALRQLMEREIDQALKPNSKSPEGQEAQTAFLKLLADRPRMEKLAQAANMIVRRVGARQRQNNWARVRDATRKIREAVAAAPMPD